MPDGYSSKTEAGMMGETAACDFLAKSGYTIIQRNFRTYYGEIDIIACDDKYIAFVEVKTRNIASKAAPRAWVTKSKQNKIIKTTMLYLQKSKNTLQPRFDVIEVVTSNDISHFQAIEINHIKNAFWLTSGYSPF